MIALDIEGMEEIRAQLRQTTVELAQKVEGDALKALANDALQIARRLGPRAMRHRGPSRRGRDRWRSPLLHAIDTIRIGPVRRDRHGVRSITVGPQRGDNSPSFYLKFVEYGYTAPSGRLVSAHPFLRPAQRAATSDDAIMAALRAAMDRRIKA